MTNPEITLRSGHRIGALVHAGAFDKNVRILIDDLDVCLVSRGVLLDADGWRTDRWKPAEIDWSACGDRAIDFAEAMAVVLVLGARIARDLDASVGAQGDDVDQHALESIVCRHMRRIPRRGRARRPEGDPGRRCEPHARAENHSSPLART